MARILVVDDDQAVLDVTKLILEYEGHEVFTASDGETIRTIRVTAQDPLYWGRQNE
jgi:CheY-like chemotaxis protein